MKAARKNDPPKNEPPARKNKNAGVEFVFPYGSAKLSTTGQECPSNCAHCGGYYLQNMLALDGALPEGENKRSFLVSGGCDSKGKIPHLEKKKELQALSQKGAINIHSGLVSEKEAEELSTLADVVSFDLVLDQEIITKVYSFDVSSQDYIFSYRALKKYLHVVPHLCLGLKGGKIDKEYETLEFLWEDNPEAVCFLVFTPTPGTPFARCRPPSLESSTRFLEEARHALPSSCLHLGCIRPGGRYRAELDSFAIQAGFDKIVQPAPPARELARQMKIKITWSEECCCL